MHTRRGLVVVALPVILAISALAGCGLEEEADALMSPAASDEATVVSPQSSLDQAIAAVQDLAFDDFVDESYRLLLLRDPDSIWYSDGANARNIGLTDMATFTNVSLEELETTRQIVEAFRDQLLAFDRTALSPDQIITYDSYLWILDDMLAMADYPLWNLCIGPSMYGLQGRLNDLLANLPIETLDDAQAYVERLQGVDKWFAQWITALGSRESAGVIPPIYELEMAIMLLEGDLMGGEPREPEALPAYTVFRDKLASVPGLDSAERQTLLASASEAIQDHVIPGFQALRDHLEYLLPQASSELGISRYDDTGDYFAALIRHHTTTDMTVDDVYQLGLEEVARLQEKMRSIAQRELGWPADLSMASMNARLDQAKLPLLQGDALLSEYERLLAEADAALDNAFSVRPSAGVEILVDPDICPACYAKPGTISDNMGYFVTTLDNMGAYTMYDETVLVHHESIPGHHYQIALTMDLDVPLPQAGPYREDFYYVHPKLQAFSEGWALYAERLAVDLGLYDDDPLSHLLSLRLWLTRTARLVVQAGLHSQGWTWNDVVGYLREATGVDERPNRKLFHISYPAQACGYNAFSLFVLDIRQRAMDTLGDKFDLKAFHYELLRHGFIPLQVLEGVMENWINDVAQS